jgi:hypothetical protein
MEVDFGEVWEDRAFPWKFTIHNPTAADVTINKFWNSCSCAAVKPDSVTIPAGGNAQLALTLDLSAAFWEKGGLSQIEVKPSKRSFEAEIIPELADGPTFRSQAWKIKGQVARVLTVSPAFLQLDEGFVCGEPFPKQKLHVTAHAPLVGIMAKCPMGSGHQAYAKRRVPDGNEWEVEMALGPDLRAGPFKFDLTLEPVPLGSRTLPSQVIPVRGSAWESVQAIPATLVLGLQQVGATAEDTVTLRSIIGAPFEVVRVESDERCTQIKPLGWDNQRRGTSYVVRQRISSFGLNECVVRFRVQTRGKEFDLDLRVAYHGKAD